MLTKFFFLSKSQTILLFFVNSQRIYSPWMVGPWLYYNYSLVVILMVSGGSFLNSVSSNVCLKGQNWQIRHSGMEASDIRGNQGVKIKRSFTVHHFDAALLFEIARFDQIRIFLDIWTCNEMEEELNFIDFRCCVCREHRQKIVFSL